METDNKPMQSETPHGWVALLTALSNATQPTEAPPCLAATLKPPTTEKPTKAVLGARTLISSSAERNRFRDNRGSMAILIVGCTFFLIILAVGIVQIMLILGGSHEVQDAVDAGTLNVGKKSVLITTKTGNGVANQLGNMIGQVLGGKNSALGQGAQTLFNSVLGGMGGPESQFNDVLDENDSVGLTNVNRIWGKALLAAMNNKQMHDANLATSDSDSHVDSMYGAAKSISDRVSDQLTNPKNHYNYFAELSRKSSTRMSTNNSKSQVIPDTKSGWDTACMERGEESNLLIEQGQLPEGFKADDPNFTKKSDDGKFRFKGYTALNVGGKDFPFVPFKTKTQPHLVSEKTFADNLIKTKPLQFWQKPIPNAFACQGRLNDPNKPDQKEQRARSFVIANPQKDYPAQFPHGFLKFQVDDNDLIWNQWPVPGEVGKDTYSSFPLQQRSHTFIIFGLGTLDVQAFVGNEYTPPTLDKALNSFNGDTDEIKKNMVQRIAQIKPGYKMSDLDDLLSSTWMVPGDKEFFIFPDSKGEIRAMTRAFAMATNVLWLPLSDNEPDGKETEMGDDQSFPMVPNFCTWQTKSVLGLSGGAAVAIAEGKFFWQPGTGWNGCLGKVRVKRKTTVYANAAGI